MRTMTDQALDECALIARRFLVSGATSSVEKAVEMAIECCCEGRGLAGAEEDAAQAADILQSVMADAGDTQGKHQVMIQRMADWETRDPGRLSSDGDLRNSFSEALASIRDGFVQRGLALVGVKFPFQLDRVNPAHAIILAVRDDISDTISMLDQMKWQDLTMKEVQNVKQFQPLVILGTAARDAAKATASMVEKTAAGVKETTESIAKYVALALAAVFGVYALSQTKGGAHAG